MLPGRENSKRGELDQVFGRLPLVSVARFDEFLGGVVVNGRGLLLGVKVDAVSRRVGIRRVP